MNLQELIARKGQLEADLAHVNAAIEAFGDSSVVEIQTHKNLRNTWGVTVNPDAADEMLMVFADQEFSRPADKSSHGGYVVRSAWEQFKLDNPDEAEYIWEI